MGRAVGVVLYVRRLGPGKLKFGMKTGHLQLSFEAGIGDRRIADAEKFVVIGEISQRKRVYEQSRLALLRIRPVQEQQFAAEFLQKRAGGSLIADAKAHSPAAINSLGERAQVQADDRPLQPESRGCNDFVAIQGCLVLRCGRVRVSYALPI